MVVILFFCLCLASYYLLVSYAGVKAFRAEALKWSDALLPIWVIGWWSLLASIGVGPQSLGNLVELPLLLFLACLLFNLRIYLVISKHSSTFAAPLVVFIITLIFTIGVRVYCPLIPE
nr:hypothetical protein BCU58_24515 [Vibrio sp. 10N.286.48.B7]